ncbi:hypothetical protein HPP92_012891 [Vanilla planifolia]|uniref:Uncharacterized protein n=1 Tax=Vanilla planifolia TaxID=51239 RepID=A0A835R0X3_VANPL|nr:hypothetical protein HPP92_012891 [Vanilla planifolia]
MSAHVIYNSTALHVQAKQLRKCRITNKTDYDGGCSDDILAIHLTEGQCNNFIGGTIITLLMHERRMAEAGSNRRCPVQRMPAYLPCVTLERLLVRRPRAG